MQERHANNMEENYNKIIIVAVPISYWNPEHVSW